MPYAALSADPRQETARPGRHLRRQRRRPPGPAGGLRAADAVLRPEAPRGDPRLRRRRARLRRGPAPARAPGGSPAGPARRSSRVFPGNLKMADDARRTRSRQFKALAYGRLPLQLPMIRIALNRGQPEWHGERRLRRRGRAASTLGGHPPRRRRPGAPAARRPRARRRVPRAAGRRARRRVRRRGVPAARDRAVARPTGRSRSRTTSADVAPGRSTNWVGSGRRSWATHGAVTSPSTSHAVAQERLTGSPGGRSTRCRRRRRLWRRSPRSWRADAAGGPGPRRGAGRACAAAAVRARPRTTSRAWSRTGRRTSPRVRAAPPMPPLRMSIECYADTAESICRELPRLEPHCRRISYPSRIRRSVPAARCPPTASTDTAERIAGAVGRTPVRGRRPLRVGSTRPATSAVGTWTGSGTGDEPGNWFAAREHPQVAFAHDSRGCRRLFVRTLREDPADAEVPSHRLLVRAGYIRRAAPGIYTWLPLGLRVLRNVERIIREEMDAHRRPGAALPRAAAPRALRGHRPLDRVRRRHLPAQGPQGRRLPARADPRGDVHARREGPVLVVQGPAAVDLPDPDEVPRRGAAPRRRCCAAASS